MSSARLLLDVPAAQPALGFPRIARAIAGIIAQSEPRFAVGIFGGWGTGKTTLMQAIEADLSDADVVCVRFSAWRYEREEHLIVPLLDAIREALVDWSDRHGGDAAAKRTASAVGRVLRSIVAGFTMTIGVPGALDMSFDANRALEHDESLRAEELESRVPRSFYHASFRALERAFEDFVAADREHDATAARRIVVFVDDLDRCLPENALQVVESMKLFFDLEGFVFVVGLDENVVENVIDAKYGREADGAGEQPDRTASRVSGAEYIKKVFQLPFRLAPVGPDQLGAFLTATYEEAGLPEEQRRDLREVVEPHLAFLAERDINPREIKRYINLFTLQVQINPQLDPHAVLALQTTSFRPGWESVRDALLEFREEYIDTLRRHVAGEQGAGAAHELEVAPDDFVAYVSEGAPGHALLEVEDLEPYASTGEAVHSTRNPMLLEALRVLGDLRRQLQTASGGQADMRRLGRELLTSLTVVESRIAAETSPLGRSVAQGAAALRQRSQETVDAIAAGAAPENALAPLVADAAVLSQRLRRLYHARGSAQAELPADPVAGLEAAADAAAAREALTLGRRLEQLGDVDGAIAAYRRADEGGDGDGAYALGVLLTGRDSWADAEAAFRRADARGHAASARELGMLLARRGQTDEALAAFARAEAGGDLEAAYHRGTLLAAEGRLSEAAEALRRADRLGVAGAASALGPVLVELGELDEAEQALRRADSHGDPDVALALGDVLERRVDLDGAEAAFRRADELGSAEAASRLVAVLQKADERRLQEAEHLLEQSLLRAAERGDRSAQGKLEYLRWQRGA
jgi:tetratricopeptide (TPR) repeat protein